MKKIISLSILSLFLLYPRLGIAQEKIEIKPTGRILMDAALFDSKNEKFVDGVGVPDIRLGVKVSYAKWKAKIDVGFAYGKVSLKDVNIDYKLSSSSLIRGGYFVHQFGLQSSTSSSMKITMEEPASNEIFFNNRLTGLMYMHQKGDFSATASIHIENEAIKRSSDDMGGEQGYGAMSRLVYRPFRADGRIFHVGISGAYETPRFDSDPDLNHKVFKLSSRFPSRVAKVTALQANVTEAKKLFKFTPELTAAYGPIGIETQYFYLNVNRDKGVANYKASGAYCILRGLLLGGDYSYNHSDSGIATPKPKSLEFVLGYNYTDMCDREADVMGGRLNDFTVGFNYYINKYMIWRLKYAHTSVRNRVGVENQDLNSFQTRFQVIF